MRIRYSEGKPPMGISRDKREAPTKEVQRNNDALVRLLQDRAATHVDLTAEDHLEGPHDLHELGSVEGIDNEENQYDLFDDEWADQIGRCSDGRLWQTAPPTDQ